MQTSIFYFNVCQIVVYGIFFTIFVFGTISNRMKDLFEFIGGIFTWLFFAAIKAVLLAPIVALAYFICHNIISDMLWLPGLGYFLFIIVVIAYAAIVLGFF